MSSKTDPEIKAWWDKHLERPMAMISAGHHTMEQYLDPDVCIGTNAWEVGGTTVASPPTEGQTKGIHPDSLTTGSFGAVRRARAGNRSGPYSQWTDTSNTFRNRDDKFHLSGPDSKYTHNRWEYEYVNMS